MVRTREKGFALIEAVIALAVISVLAGAALTGLGAHLGTVRASFDDLALTRLASGRLDEIRAADAGPVPGEREVPAPRPGVTMRETVREREPGLFEVTVAVAAGGNAPRVSLTTLVAREVAR